MHRLDVLTGTNGTGPARPGARFANALRLLRPRSFVALLASGFLAVGGPLATGLILSSVELDRLADESEGGIRFAVDAARTARLFALDLEAADRSARQYVVLRDASRRDALVERIGALTRRAGAVSRSLPRQAAAVEGSAERIAALPDAIDAANSGADRRALVQRAFTDSGALVGAVVAAGDALAAAESIAMRERADRARTLLQWQSIGIGLGVFALSVVAFVLIARPIRQLDRAIRRLGSGHLERVVSISGPRDMVELGERLDWLRTQLAATDAHKTRFLRHVSHELKTPLASLREGANLLREELAGPLTTSQREVVAIVHDSTRKMEALINDLLGLTRLPHQLDNGEWHDVRLDEIVTGVVADHTLAMQARGIEHSGAMSPLSVRGTRAALTAIVDNLISNAIKYCAPGGAVRTTIQTEGDVVRLDVADDGPGIDREDREHVFEPFFRGRRRANGALQGSGLGLTIARDAAAALGGTIEVDSSASGGALMRVRLPRAAASAPA